MSQIFWGRDGQGTGSNDNSFKTQQFMRDGATTAVKGGEVRTILQYIGGVKGSQQQQSSGASSKR